MVRLFISNSSLFFFKTCFHSLIYANSCLFLEYYKIITFSIQMCVNAQFSRKDFQSQAIFIDTEGSFSTIRVMQIAEETIKKLKENSIPCNKFFKSVL
jgi:hypothetical protein